MKHKTVLKKIAVDELNLKPNSVVVDATLGAGGHTFEIVKRLEEHGRIISFDVDPLAIKEIEKIVSKKNLPIRVIQANFKNLSQYIQPQSVDAVLADLGWRSEQFTESNKGFSFNAEEPLLMTYGRPSDYLFTASDIVNNWDKKDIINVIKGYGEERFAVPIANKIVTERANKPIQTSKQLADIVSLSIPRRFHSSKIHPATKTFQAIRIAVNDELSVVDRLIDEAWTILKKGGYLSIISFHSLEDRIVKHRFRDYVNKGVGKLLHKKPTTPDDNERLKNKRARSAKLRTIIKIDY